uniref:Uncharacterized protein n=1 Tax=Bionectria ochroleuca TaxID=29856 RepID=A0A0B7JKQ9_BIOOC
MDADLGAIPTTVSYGVHPMAACILTGPSFSQHAPVIGQISSLLAAPLQARRTKKRALEEPHPPPGMVCAWF